MFNMGRFGNIRMAHNTYKPIHPNYGQPQPRIGLFDHCCGHSHYSGPTNITINQGPQGFWGFMGGLFGGFLGGIGLGGLFGGNQFGMYGMNNMYGMGGVPNYGSLFNNVNLLNLGNTSGATGGITQGTPQAKQLKNLNELFNGYKIVPESDGTFTSISKDGKTILSGSYEDMKTKLSEDQIKYGKTEKKDTVDDKDETVVDDKDETVVDDKDETVVDDKDETVVDDKDETVVDDKDETVVDDKDETVVDDKDETVVDDKDETVVDNNKEHKPQTKPVAVEANKVQAGTYQDSFTVHDDVQGKAADINAQSYKFGTINTQGYPSNITVKGRTYNFVEVKNGTAIYETVKANGVKEQYRLEQNPDGKCALNQYEGDIGAGKSAPSNTNNKNSNVNSSSNNNTPKTISLAGKPVTIEFYSDIQYENPLSKNGSNGGYAKATVNGRTYTVSVGAQDSHAKVMEKLGEAMIRELKKNGYKDIKLNNQNFNFQMSETGEVKNVQGNNNKIDWNNAANKQKRMKLNIEFSIKVNAGNVGTASVKLPNGEEITAWVGPSLTSQRARASLADDIQSKLQEAGWTNVTLVNDNFNWESGPKKE